MTMYMNADRGSTVVIGEKEYTLLLTTGATKAIAAKYGGLEDLGDRLMKGGNFEQTLGEVVWLITLLANQSVLIRNLRDREHPEPLLTEEVVELLTSPADLADFRTAITDCLVKGTKRNVVSEDTGKNTEAG